VETVRARADAEPGSSANATRRAAAAVFMG
jgi:hypothetical protein